MTWSTTPVVGQHDQASAPSAARPCATAASRGRASRARGHEREEAREGRQACEHAARRSIGSAVQRSDSAGCQDRRGYRPRFALFAADARRAAAQKSKTSWLQVSMPVADGRDLGRASANVPSSLSVSRIGDRAAGGVGDVDDAEVDRADVGRVVVEQPDERNSGTKSAASSSRHSRRRPPREVAVARVEVAADADRPAIVEPRVAAGPGAAHEEVARPVAQDEVRDDLLVARVRLGRRPRREAALGGDDVQRTALEAGRRTPRQPGSAHDRGRAARRGPAPRSLTSAVPRGAPARPRAGLGARPSSGRPSGPSPRGASSQSSSGRAQVAQAGRRSPRRSWPRCRRPSPGRRGRGASCRASRSPRGPGGRGQSGAPAPPVRRPPPRRARRRATSGRWLIAATARVVVGGGPCGTGCAPQARASASTARDVGLVGARSAGDDDPRPAPEQLRRRRRRTRSSRGRPSGGRRRTAARARPPRATIRPLVLATSVTTRPGASASRAGRRARPAGRDRRSGGAARTTRSAPRTAPSSEPAARRR